MSLYSALYAGVSGLSAQSSAMATVADNITNVNTVGYKGEEADFRTMVNDGNMKSRYSAGGVAVTPRALISKGGNIQAGSATTDLAIDGQGFFVTRAGAPGDKEAPTTFTRAGAFRPDAEGYLRNTNGDYLLGWKMDAKGQVQNNGSVSSMEPVRVSDLAGTAMPTTRMQFSANLQSTQPSDATSTFTRTVQVFDELGNGHDMQMAFTKTGNNQWSYTFTGDGVPAGTTGTINFQPNGQLPNPSPLPDTLTLNFPNAGSANIALDVKLTQFSTQSTENTKYADGGPLGSISSIDVSKDGIVSASFSNGVTRKAFQLPLATFPNPDGLTRLNGNSYVASADSGAVVINKPGSGGGGKLLASQLEGSNVDLAGEFTNMIRFQRAYSASSKIITTVDDMLQELSNLKR